MPIPTPPKDLSGGYALLEYSNGVRTHKQRLHLADFAPDTGNFTGFVGTGGTVTNTLDQYIAAWRNFYNTAWNIQCVDIVQLDRPSGVFTPTTVAHPTPHAGHGVPQTPESDYAALEYSIMCSTGGSKRKLRVNLIGSDQLGIGETPILSSGSGGAYAALDTLVAMLSSGGVGIVSREGFPASGAARMTRTFNRRLRRHYGFA